MKRNRLLNSSAQSKMFKTDSSSNKHRHILILSFFLIVGIFLTTIVLATGEPSVMDNHSQIISLPEQSGEISDTHTDEMSVQQTNNIYLPVQSATTVATETDSEPVANIDETAVDERAAVEQLHLQQENATEAAPTADVAEVDVAPAAVDLSWQDVTVKSGDNLSLIFPKVGLSARDVYNVAQIGKPIKPLLNLKPGQVLRFGLIEDEAGKAQLQQLELQLSPVETLQISQTDTGFTTETLLKETDNQQKQVFGEISSSLFEAGLKAGMSDKLIMEMAHIFGWDIDFALDIRQGDNFKVIFEEAFLDGKKYKDGNILAAEFTNQGKTFRAVRYTDAEGNSHFYTPDGDSMRKTFTRTPVHFSRISSRFNPNRKHPVLKTSRPHRGVDYAAPTGTPILATGDGKVDFVGTKGGYGRTVILSHGGKYTTLYGHMSRFKSGLKSGQRVKQGQTIGYVGMSGLATGPHLHYEFRVNGVHRNPLTVALPKAEPLAAKYMADFKQKAQPLLSKLDQLSVPALAANQY